MAKSGKRRHRRPEQHTNPNLKTLQSAAGTGLLTFLCFLLFAAFAALYQMRAESPNAKQTQVVIWILYAVCSLLNGIVCTHRKKYSVFPKCLYAGIVFLLCTFLCILPTGVSHWTMLICLPIGLSLLCPIVGGYIGKRI